MRQANHPSRRVRHGFSITELLVSISIIVLLIGITYPFLSAVNSGSRVEAGLNIVGMSSDVARQWVQAVSWANDGSTSAPTLESYSGTAALYCPTGEVRILVNDRLAEDSGLSPSYLEDNSTVGDGFKDISQVDYIRIPDGVGIVGIQRTGSGATDVRFIAPPFAITFNELGQLNYGDNNGYIYYDADRDNTYDTGSVRLNGYNPADWTGREGSPNYDSTAAIQDLPFEAIECVSGVIVFSLDEYTGAGFDFDGNRGAVAMSTTAGTAGKWLQDNGQTVFFSPLTGVVLRDEQQQE